MRRNLELPQISKDLRISTRFLEAMEADRFDKLPGGVFTKSFVRQYARALGLDDQEIAASLQRMLEPPPVQPEVSDAKKPSPASVLPRGERWPALASHFPSSSSWGSLALVVVAVLVGVAVYSWSQRRHSAPVSSRTPAVAQAVKPQATVPAEPAKAEPPPATLPAEAGTAERVVSSPVQVQLTAEKPVWVLATTDGKVAFSGTIEPNVSKVIEANDRVFLKLGNAGGVHVSLNGKPLGPLGEEGKVLRVQFTSGGFQIVPAPIDEDGPSVPGDSPKEPLAPL